MPLQELASSLNGVKARKRSRSTYYDTRIKNKENDHYLISNIYSPLQKTKQQRSYFEKILNHITKMNKQKHPIIWGGEFNNEHGDRERERERERERRERGAGGGGVQNMKEGELEIQ